MAVRASGTSLTEVFWVGPADHGVLSTQGGAAGKYAWVFKVSSGG